MNKRLTSIILALTLTLAPILTPGCSEEGKRFWRLVKLSDEINNYVPTPAEKKYNMQETRQELDRAMKIAEKHTNTNYQP